MRERQAFYAFNRGMVSPLGLARIDQKRISMSAEVMTNWIARVLGSMALRPGLGYIGATSSNAAARFVPFVFGTSDTSLVEFTNAIMRVWINDVLLTRVAVATAITNGTFSGNITGWTDGSDVGASISWDTGNFMKLTGTGTAHAIGYQAVTVAAGDQAKENGLHITIQRGPVTLKIGTSLGDDSLVNQTVLDTGVHSIAFTPNTATFYVQFISAAAYKVQVASCVVESAGVVTITSPYLTADLSSIRYDQSGDIVFVAGGETAYQQRKIERRGTRPGARSWSLCLYHTDDGPFMAPNVGPITLTAANLTGDTTITASDAVFSVSHLNGIFSMTNQVAGVSASITGDNSFSTGLKVTGVGAGRSIEITITGTWVATVVLQSAPDNSTWADVPGEIWNGNVAGPYLDGLDGQTMFYRIGVKTSGFTSGTVQAALTFTSGTITGVLRITAFTSSKSVSAQILSDIGSTSATAQWSEGSWSTVRGWPTAVRFHEGRLWWSGHNGVFGSVSDNYYSYNQEVIGDAGPINRTIGSGPVDSINWLLSLQRMVIGAQGAEISARSSAIDSPLTPTDFALRTCSTQGSASVDPVKVDLDGIFVDRTSTRVYKLSFDLRNYLSPDYSSTDLTAIIPELGLPGIIRMAVQRKPDTRIHCVRSDGTVMLLIFDTIEDVTCWSLQTSTGGGGLIEDAVVLPGAVGSTEDQVYYVVNRTINGSTVRYLEKWAKETECRGGTLNKQADAFVTYTGAAVKVITGLSHLEAASVIVWGDGADFSPTTSGVQRTYTVSGGSITLDTAVSNAVIGLPYIAQWQSAKLGIQPSAINPTLNQQKRINHVGVVATFFHPKGIQFGPDFSHLDNMPTIESGAVVSSTAIRTDYEEQEIPFDGPWTTDARLCLQAQAPRPITLLAAVVNMETVS